jgi:hypothetical protein
MGWGGMGWGGAGVGWGNRVSACNGCAPAYQRHQVLVGETIYALF